MTAYANVGHILLKRGNTSTISSYVASLAEPVMDTQANLVYIGDGVTPGGHLVSYGNVNASAYLPTYSGNIAANIAKNGYNWTFGTDGNVTFPDNTVQSTAFNNHALSTYAGNITANSISVTSVIQYANLTTNQIANIAPVAAGMTVFNYSTGNIQVYNGTKWANIILS